jgi:hypothetical protein
MDAEAKTMLLQIMSGLQRNSGYLARVEIENILSCCRKDPKRLEPFGFKVASQGDEDGIIEEIFRRLNITRGTFCEIGVENGLECNSLYLIHKGWHGWWVEGNANYRAFIEEKFKSILNARLRVAIAIITAENINQIFDQIGVLRTELDFLSIDIDGNDVYLLQALQLSPKVLCIEYNAKFPANISKKQKYDPNRVWTGTDYMGSNLAAINEVASKKGYKLVGTNITGANAFFVRNDLAGDLFVDDSSPTHLHNPPRYWLIFDHYQNIGFRADFGPYVDLESSSRADVSGGI